MRFLIIGNGGREHAIIRSLQKNKTIEIHCAPGIEPLAEQIINIKIAVSEFDKLLNYAKSNKIDYTFVGPEAPLVDGIVDYFEASGQAIFGPTKAAAQIEASKAFSKKFMQSYHIPTASYKQFSNYNEALLYINSLKEYPIVIKASGLAAGKGVVIPENLVEAQRELAEMMLDKKFGNAADEIVIESFLQGEEASVFAICDGANYVLLSPAQDHKRIGEGDIGKNTGGMGAYAPAPVVNPKVINAIEKLVLKPFLAGMQAEKHPYKGVLFIGLMIQNEEASVVEFNCRFGDPETQVVLPLLNTDLAELIKHSIDGTLDQINVKISEESAMTVVIASGGYPDSYQKGYRITGLDKLKDVEICYAGTTVKDGQIVSNGGRVLNLISISNSFEKCAELIYSQIEQIEMTDKYYRRDIGHNVLNN